MGKYDAQGKDFGDIHDLFALRVLVDSVSDCYKALGVIHNFWRPVPEEFDDFIANPKDNGYQALHTTVMCQGTTPLEIQIRTYDMHRSTNTGWLLTGSIKKGKWVSILTMKCLAAAAWCLEGRLDSENFWNLLKPTFLWIECLSILLKGR
jgi:hypothetical protein